jgi:hypothetical protein
MPVDITRTLRIALSDLQQDKERLDRQIAAIGTALGGDTVSPRRGRMVGIGPAERPAPPAADECGGPTGRRSPDEGLLGEAAPIQAVGASRTVRAAPKTSDG